MEDEDEFQEELDEEEKEQIDPIYEGKLEPKDIADKPILKPVADVNKSFMDFQKLLNKSLLDYKRSKQAINDMISEMPKYSQTMIIAEVQKLVSYIENFIFLSDHIHEILKRTVKLMVDADEERN